MHLATKEKVKHVVPSLSYYELYIITTYFAQNQDIKTGIGICETYFL